MRINLPRQNAYLTSKRKKLNGNTLAQLAYDLGCEIECPHIPANKYTNIRWLKEKDKSATDEELEELNIKWQEEQERLNELIEKEYDKYYNDIGQWLTNYALAH